MSQNKDKDTMDKSQLDALGKHFARVEKGDVKPFDPAAHEKGRIPRMGLTPEEIAKMPPRPAQK